MSHSSPFVAKERCTQYGLVCCCGMMRMGAHQPGDLIPNFEDVLLVRTEQVRRRRAFFLKVIRGKVVSLK